MVGVINPNENFTLDVQKAALADVKFQLSPGEPWPAEASPSTTGSASSTSTSTSSTTAPSTDSVSSSSSPSGLSSGAIAGIAVGAAAVLIIAIALIWFCGRKGGIEKGYRKSTIGNPPPPSMMEANYDNQHKSPPPPTYRDHGSRSEGFRSPSPAQWSQTGSPHTSYVGYPSPGLASPWSEAHAHGQVTPCVLFGVHLLTNCSEPPKAVSPAPVELMGSTTHPGSPPPGRHEFPA